MFIMCGANTVEGPMVTHSPCELADDANLPLKLGPAIIDSTLFLVLLKNGSLQNPLLQNCRRRSLNYSLRKSATGIFLTYMIMVNKANDEQLWGPIGKRSWSITFSAPYCPNFIPKELHWADGKNHLANPANRKPTDPYNLAYGISVTFVFNLSFSFHYFCFRFT
jgi:hypothetical protein